MSIVSQVSDRELTSAGLELLIDKPREQPHEVPSRVGFSLRITTLNGYEVRRAKRRVLDPHRSVSLSTLTDQIDSANIRPS
jgi:hypothetical protein